MFLAKAARPGLGPPEHAGQPHPTDRRRHPFQNLLALLSTALLGVAAFGIGLAFAPRPASDLPTSLDLLDQFPGPAGLGRLLRLLGLLLLTFGAALLLSTLQQAREDRSAQRRGRPPLRPTTPSPAGHKRHPDRHPDRRGTGRRRQRPRLAATGGVLAAAVLGFAGACGGVGPMLRQSGPMAFWNFWLDAAVLLTLATVIVLALARLARSRRLGLLARLASAAGADTSPAGLQPARLRQRRRVLLAATLHGLIGAGGVLVLVPSTEPLQAIGGTFLAFAIGGLVTRLTVQLRPEVAAARGAVLLAVPLIVPVIAFGLAALSWGETTTGSPDSVEARGLLLARWYREGLPGPIAVPPLIYASAGPLGTWLGWSLAQALMNTVAEGGVLLASQTGAAEPAATRPTRPTLAADPGPASGAQP